MKKQNTLLNYFKSPKAVEEKNKENSQSKRETPKVTTPKATTPKATTPRGRGTTKNKENKTQSETPKRKRPAPRKKIEDKKEVKKNEKNGRNKTENKDKYLDDEDEEKDSEESPVKVKRRRIIIPDEDSGEDSEDDYKPDPDESVSDSEFSEGVESSEVTTENDTDDDPTPKKKRNMPSRIKSKSTATKSDTTSSYNETMNDNPTATGRGSRPWPHLTFEFLQPENIRDAERRRPDHPDYNPKTLYVPQDFLEKQTPGARQWWTLKSQHYDCILFFKVGKFYELYHMDAVIGATELNMNYMSGEWAHSGFPEQAYARFVGMLVEKGYKVARIEQTETPDMMAERCKKAKKITKFDKVVRREICQISNRGTRVQTVQDDQIDTPFTNYLLSIVEKTSPSRLPTYGVCFIDTSIGVFHLGQFEDDISNSRLLTLLSHCSPAQIVYERGNLSRETLRIMNNLPSTIREPLQKEVEFFSASDTLRKLHEGDYFNYESNEFSWPDGLKPFLNQQDHLGITPAEDKELAVNALGGCLYILKHHVLDHQILAQRKFDTYTPPDMTFIDGNENTEIMRASMVLDAATINNLMILGKEDSLIKTLDYCCTPFGKRLLKEWVCRPSCRKNTIISRQNAITELVDCGAVVQQARKKLNELPDLERLLSKVHAHGNAARMKNDPDGRAIMFEPKTYAKRKIQDFITILRGFENVLKINELFNSFQSSLICQITKTEPDGQFPDLSEFLTRFKNGFNHEEALEAGCIVPKRGMDPEYDTVVEELDELKKDANAFLKKQSKHFGVEIKFATNARQRYQIEVPDSKASLASNGYELQGQKKGFKRYTNVESVNLLERQIIIDEKREKVLKDVNRRAFANFSKEYDMWSAAVYNVAVLDALISLAEYAKSGDMCVPEFCDNTNGVIISIKEGRHPCIISDKFVPNDTVLGAQDVAPLVIVTGPNMGGKSTLMRQVGLLTVMAHIGCHIPAENCKLTLVDRIFTRLGAGDDILTCRSTFLVELTETSVILRHVTQHSLVLLDELGRGTSTYDGTAIAAAVIDALSRVKCRTLFSTHYHSLVDDFNKNPNVSLAHMACQVETEEEDEVTEETVTFLYKFVEGACPKSYGFNAARLAGIPLSITKRAHEIAEKLEREVNRRKMFIKLWKANSESLKNVITELQKIPV